MVTTIQSILDVEALAVVRRLTATAAFVPGQTTAGWAAQAVKKNLQLAGDSSELRQISEIVLPKLSAHETFRGVALPKALSPLMVSRSDPGMGYGAHMDDALMGNAAFRTDLAYTLFLSDEADYDGGELVIDEARGETAIKLPAGGLVLYPATALHRVEPVRRGSRMVAIGWVQSLVRDPQIREMLIDLQLARRLTFSNPAYVTAFNLMSKTHANLLRKFSEP